MQLNPAFSVVHFRAQLSKQRVKHCSLRPLGVIGKFYILFKNNLSNYAPRDLKTNTEMLHLEM